MHLHTNQASGFGENCVFPISISQLTQCSEPYQKGISTSEETKSYRFGTTWDFGGPIPLNPFPCDPHPQRKDSSLLFQKHIYLGVISTRIESFPTALYILRTGLSETWEDGKKLIALLPPEVNETVWGCLWMSRACGCVQLQRDDTEVLVKIRDKP